MNTRSLVEVEWLDSISEGRWMTFGDHLREIDGNMRHLSAGYVIRDGEEALVIAGSVNATADVAADVMAIPRPAVLSVKRLEAGS